MWRFDVTQWPKVPFVFDKMVSTVPGGRAIQHDTTNTNAAGSIGVVEDAAQL